MAKTQTPTLNEYKIKIPLTNQKAREKIMRKMFLSILTLIFLAACGGDSGTNIDEGNFNYSDIVGTWDVTKYQITSKADPNKTIDFLISLGGNFSITYNADRTFIVTVTIQGQTTTTTGVLDPDVDAPTYDDPQTGQTYEMSYNGNILRIKEDVDFFFDANIGFEPAVFEWEMRRR